LAVDSFSLAVDWLLIGSLVLIDWLVMVMIAVLAKWR
jgi:hypothetical protein